MKKVISSLVIGAVSISSVAMATPTLAKSEKSKNEREHKSYESKKYETRTLPSGNTFTTESGFRILENKNKIQIKQESGKKLMKPINLKFKLHDEEDEFKLSIPKGVSASSAAEFVTAVQKAHTDYLAAIRSARQAFLSAILQARNNFLNGGTTTTTNTAPTITSVAAASPSTVTGNTTSLSVLASDTAGEATLNYSWSVVSKPSTAGNPSFSANGTNAAKNTTVTFFGAGSYQFQVTVTDPGLLTVTSTVNVTVNQTLSSVSVSPVNTTVQTGSTTQFTASALDQFGLAQSSGFNWSVSEILGGLVNTSGLYTAPSATGTFHVVASSNVDSTKKATSTVNVVSP